MTEEKVKQARLTALRFVNLADELLDMTLACPWYQRVGSKKSGALRRASLDLTRILAEMRKP